MSLHRRQNLEGYSHTVPDEAEDRGVAVVAFDLFRRRCLWTCEGLSSDLECASDRATTVSMGERTCQLLDRV